MLVDLGAGLGGASEAFMDDPSWIVRRFDIAPEVCNVPNMCWGDYVNDTSYVIKLIWQCMETNGITPNNLYIWASPECKEWSDGFNSKKSTARRNKKEFIPNLEQVTAIRHIVEVLKPRAWILENVRGGQEFISPLLGEPRTVKNPFYLWGNFPLFVIPDHDVDKTSMGPNAMRYWERSKIPIELSRSMKKAFDNQTTLMEFFS